MPNLGLLTESSFTYWNILYKKKNLFDNLAPNISF
jgi:hypothetical protein